jgi:hypothetical protein
MIIMGRQRNKKGEYMKISIQIKVHTEDDQIVLHYWKEFESQSIPSVGMDIKDDLFAETKRIIQVVLDYSRNQCFVTLEPRQETKERLNSGHIQELADMHKWMKMDQ